MAETNVLLHGCGNSPKRAVDLQRRNDIRNMVLHIFRVKMLQRFMRGWLRLRIFLVSCLAITALNHAILRNSCRMGPATFGMSMTLNQ